MFFSIAAAHLLLYGTDYVNMTHWVQIDSRQTSQMWLARFPINNYLCFRNRYPRMLPLYWGRDLVGNICHTQFSKLNIDLFVNTYPIYWYLCIYCIQFSSHYYHMYIWDVASFLCYSLIVSNYWYLTIPYIVFFTVSIITHYDAILVLPIIYQGVSSIVPQYDSG